MLKLTAEQKTEKKIAGYLKTLKAMNFSKRLRLSDPTIWKSEPEHTKAIADRLGWLTVPAKMQKRIDEINAFVSQAKKEFTHCVVMGMGGSSLAPEVFRCLFPTKKGFLKVYVIDSTHPDWVTKIEKLIDIKKTLFIFSSKSGGTVEPTSFFRHFYAAVGKHTSNPSEQFMAITDAGTGLEKMAKEMKFRNIFINPSDIGGRFSALSLFGLLPAALNGIDVEKLIKRALETLAASQTEDSPAVRLGAAMGGFAADGADKLSLILPSEMEPFGLWVEQLVAESTGKEGKGIVPVAGEKILPLQHYGHDRIFVNIVCPSAPDKAKDAFAKALRAAGHHVITIEMADMYDLASQFMLWEIATAAAGAYLKIDPFDQPNVQESKALTQQILREITSEERKPADPCDIEIAVTAAAADSLGEDAFALDTLRRDVMALLKTGDYAGVLAYANETPLSTEIFSALRSEFVKSRGSATLFGYGPRYLHSTGQLHKGGANTGVFFMVLTDAIADVSVPGEAYTFYDLVKAQAHGDFRALDAKGRRAVLLHIHGDPDEALKLLAELMSACGGEEKEMPTKTAVKKVREPKKRTAVKTPVSAACLALDYPKSNEVIYPGHYAFRISASDCTKVEISIDDQPWVECHNASGYWWHEWMGTAPGSHQVVARMYVNGDVVVSRRRRFKIG